MKYSLVFVLLHFSFNCFAQQKENYQLFEGILAVGYVDNGAYLNFTGPNISIQKGESKVILGMLPSLRYKRDIGTTTNPIIFPSLGIGLSCSYKNMVLQLPLYFNPKTNTQNGSWQLGVGIGFKLSALNKNQKIK